jgi:hypothetical protein
MQRNSKRIALGINNAGAFMKALKVDETGLLEPPDHVTLTSSEMPFFYEIIEEFSRKDWTSHQLSLVAFLAREMYSLEKQQRLSRKEGAVLDTGRGTIVVNPRLTVIARHSHTILNFRRSLALHARAIGKTLHDRARDLKTAAGMEDTREMLDENEDLLPRGNNGFDA